MLSGGSTHHRAKGSNPVVIRHPRRNANSVLNLIFLLVLSKLDDAHGGWIDIETPLEKRTTKSLVDGTEYELVMSDEFNVEGRSFKDGHDTVWTALDKSDDDSSSAGGGSQQFYNSSTVTTENGFLKLATKLGKTQWNRFNHVNKSWSHETTHFKSGMVQSWDKFCFTGGILEVDIIFPGNPYIGGLWPAVWMLGNLGRATYEASTNMIWPWSFDTCNRTLQPAQDISACNKRNHYGMNPNQGRGATEIDLVEVMTGDSHGFFDVTDPPVGLPYCDMTLQIAPGITKNRPQSGSLPVKANLSAPTNPYVRAFEQNWYKDLEYHGNTSINPFFYGTYLDETKPGEPVTRTKKQAFQADAVGVVHQLTPAHFKKPHTFRLEWQPGAGGRIDWFAKGYKVNETYWTTGDGNGKDWVPVFAMKDKNLKEAMGAQIPAEPTYLIMNTAISSTWGFPYDKPEWCKPCFDCNNPKCDCNFHPGFCEMLRAGDVAMYIDYIRVYQSKDPSAHVGDNHTLGCDPPAYPTRDWIKGHEYRYMRNPPFSYEDKHPLRKVQRGGGECKTDTDCGGDVSVQNYTKIYEKFGGESLATDDGENTSSGRGKCVSSKEMKAMFSNSMNKPEKVCKCSKGFTGPNCLAQEYVDETLSAQKLRLQTGLLKHIVSIQVPPFMFGVVITMVTLLLIVLVLNVAQKRRAVGLVNNPK